MNRLVTLFAIAMLANLAGRFGWNGFVAHRWLLTGSDVAQAAVVSVILSIVLLSEGKRR